MGIQDKIYDVAAALEEYDCKEAALFDELLLYMYKLEKELDLYRKFYYNASELKQNVEDIERWKKQSLSTTTKTA